MTNIVCKFYKYSFKIVFAILLVVFATSNIVFARTDTLCSGEEFNKRVMSFLNDNDPNITTNRSITIFERGNNPPNDRAYYVDVSEDMDESIIVYVRDRTLYWYSPSNAVINENLAKMFYNFVNIRNINLSDFIYLNGLTDTRYMFGNCRNLRKLTLKTGAQMANMRNPFMPSEMQGMFYNCESLQNIDLSAFDTHHVDNMKDLFYKCYNVKNIYVDRTKWNVESVYFFNKMFGQCHNLRSNMGRKAVDVDEDDYGDFAIPGSENKEGFLKDINTQYDDYGQDLSPVPIDDDHYIPDLPATTAAYGEEPEGDDVGTGGGGSGDNAGAYVGDSKTGYNAEKEQLTGGSTIGTSEVVTSESAVNTSETTSSIVVETSGQNVEQVIIETNISVDTSVSAEIINPETSIVEEETITIENETTESVDIEDENENVEENTRMVLEIDNTDDEKEGLSGEEAGGNGGLIDNLSDNVRFLIFAFVISIVAILLLIGMVIYLFKDKSEGKDKDSHNV